MKEGVYKHFKGGEYGVLGVAEHSETGEKMVVYCSKKGRASSGGFGRWANSPRR